MHTRGTTSLLRPFGVLLLIGVLCAGIVLPVFAVEREKQHERAPVVETPSDDVPGKLLGDDPNDGAGDGDPNEDSMTSLEELARALGNWLKKFTKVSFR